MFLLKEVEESYNQFSQKVFEDCNILDNKTKELIAVACSVMADCAPCLEHHYQRAAQAGATKEEGAEALAVAMSICAGSKRAKYAGVIGRLEA